MGTIIIVGVVCVVVLAAAIIIAATLRNNAQQQGPQGLNNINAAPHVALDPNNCGVYATSTTGGSHNVYAVSEGVVRDRAQASVYRGAIQPPGPRVIVRQVPAQQLPAPSTNVTVQADGGNGTGGSGQAASSAANETMIETSQGPIALSTVMEILAASQTKAETPKPEAPKPESKEEDVAPPKNAPRKQRPKSTEDEKKEEGK